MSLFCVTPFLDLASHSLLRPFILAQTVGKWSIAPFSMTLIFAYALSFKFTEQYFNRDYLSSGSSANLWVQHQKKVRKNLPHLDLVSLRGKYTFHEKNNHLVILIVKPDWYNLNLFNVTCKVSYKIYPDVWMTVRFSLFLFLQILSAEAFYETVSTVSFMFRSDVRKSARWKNAIQGWTMASSATIM